ncbi:hypothetical protein EYC84_010729 [Monilinia fructicola]|uniref:Uncharacterized protein n=1 Tax=Monilinia fructicola TaxID=38448 RepID=A0A5M9J8V4_MONFR|nr:hypothetical protein EYC84_010729 [Monilinia fructicola]
MIHSIFLNDCQLIFRTTILTTKPDVDILIAYSKLGLDAPTFAAIKGAHIPPSLLREWAIPHPVPLLGPGNVSGNMHCLLLDSKHDVLKKDAHTPKNELKSALVADSEKEKEYSSDHRCDRHRYSTTCLTDKSR